MLRQVGVYQLLAVGGKLDEQVINVDCGYGGKRDPMGNVIAPGWQQLELPSDSGDSGERSYASLRARLEAD